MAGFGGVLGGIGIGLREMGQADAQAIERRKALQALSMAEMDYQQKKQAQQREQAAAATNWSSLTSPLPGAQPMPQAAAGPAPAAPQPQGPQPPMPGQSSVPTAAAMPRPVGPGGPAAAMSQPPPPAGGQPGGTVVPSGAPPGAGPGGPAASLSNPGTGSPGAQPSAGQQQLSQPADMLRQMATELRRANPGIDPMTAMEAIKQRVDLMKGLEPDLRNQISLYADMLRDKAANSSLDEKYFALMFRAQSSEELMRIRQEYQQEKDANKWQLLTDPEHTDESGNVVPAKQYWATSPGPGRPPSYMDMSGQPYTPAGAQKLGGTGGGAGGGREGTQIGRVISAGELAVKDAQNLMELPVSANRGFFGGREQGGSLMDAAKETLTNSMTSQEVQDYNTTMTGMQRNLSGIEATGLMPSGSLTKQMDQVVIREGDSYLTAMRKMAQIRQIVTSGMKFILQNPRVPEQQKAEVRAVTKQMEQAIPFTVHDVNQLERSKKPQQTMSDYAKQQGLGVAPQDAQDQPPEGVDPTLWQYMTPEEKALWRTQ